MCQIRRTGHLTGRWGVGYNARMQRHADISGTIVFIFLQPCGALLDGYGHRDRTLFAYENPAKAENYFHKVTDVGPGHSVILSQPYQDATVLFDGIATGERVDVYLYTDDATLPDMDRAFFEFLRGQQNHELRASIRDDHTGVVVISRRKKE